MPDLRVVFEFPLHPAIVAREIVHGRMCLIIVESEMNGLLSFVDGCTCWLACRVSVCCRINFNWTEPDGTKVSTEASVGQSLLEIAIKEEIDLEGTISFIAHVYRAHIHIVCT